MDVTVKDPYKTSRVLYIIEAALEYFISIAVGTVYLAKLTTYIGFSDAVTGILSSVCSLGCGFQIVAVFLSKYKPVKVWVTISHIVSQIFFAMLYFIPLMDLPKTAKVVLFCSMLLLANIIHNVINSPKINWFMALVPDCERGKFTATKEIVSLIGGMMVSFLLGEVLDYYTEKNQLETAFMICGAGLFVIMLLHSLTLIFSKEKKVEVKATSSLGELKAPFKNKSVLKILLVFILWYIAVYATIPFMGTYQVKELGFSTSFSSIIIMVASLSRALLSRPLGKYADKHSFSTMLGVCFLIEALGFGICAFAIPLNGKVVYFVFYVLYCIGQAGISSSIINLVYDYVSEEQRTSALALSLTFNGLSGFFTTLALSPLVTLIQNNGNQILGIRVYAQQLFSIFAMAITLFLFFYVKKVITRIPKPTEKENSI